jgi:preprotein translocase subunit SecB
MPSFPLQLKRHYVSSLQFSAAEQNFPGPQTAKATASIAMGQNTTAPNNWRVALTVEFTHTQEQNELAKGNIVMVGIFDVSEGFPAEEMPRFVAINGANLLYGAAREMIATVGGRAFKRLAPLPVMTFHDISLQQEQRAAEGPRVAESRVPTRR